MSLRIIKVFISFFMLFSANAMAVDWSVVETLEKDQKFESAHKRVTQILEQSIKNNDVKNWTKALVKSSDYRIANGKWETAAKELQSQPWPKDNPSKTTLNLYKAYVLKTYLTNYQWEIQQREEIANLKPLDLKKMTKEQLTAVVNQSFDAALNTLPEAYTKVSGMLKESLKIGTYPSHIRGSVRDTISYLWADFLRQENFWSAKQANATDRIAIKRLLVPSAEAISLTDNKIHPLQRYTHLLTNLEKWHTKAGRKEAALEAYRERLLKTFNVLKSEKDKALLIDALSQRNQKEKALPWVTMALWTQATLQQRLVRGDALLLSKATLDNCLALDAKSAGYAYCDNALKRLMEPDFDIQLMKTDGLKKRSVKITHKNVETLYFRVIDGSKVPENQQRGTAADLIPLLLKQPVLWEWSEALPASKDLQSHISYSTPPIDRYGSWRVVVSNDPKFAPDATIKVATFQTTRLVASVKTQDKTVTVTVYHGESGHFVPNAKVDIWKRNYQTADRLIKSATTNTQGVARLSVPTGNDYYASVSSNNDQVKVENLYVDSARQPPRAFQRSLLFTDRAIYRPEQKVQWKVVAYQGKGGTRQQLKTSPNTKGWVRLLDANGKLVKEEKVTTNSYGSASGTFVIPKGRLLGYWRIRTSWQGHSGIRVEEYKRPTFSVKLDDSEKALRLNQTVHLKGTAAYLFGQNVTDGKVKWRVTRQPIYDWRWHWMGRGVSSQQETIATGESLLDSKGRFNVQFLPTARATEEASDLVSYRFGVTADVTDKGGETRSASRNFRLGNIAISATISMPDGFALSNKPIEVSIQRTDLDNVPRKGLGSWRLNRLIQPNSTLLPADLKQKISPEQMLYATKGDQQLPRWVQEQSFEAVVRAWKQGNTIQQGSLNHDETGTAKLILNNVPVGIYRLNYTTKDRWGKAFSSQKTLLVANGNDNRLRLPLLLTAQQTSVEVGNNLNVLVGSGLKDTPVLLEVYHGNKRLQQRILKNSISVVSFPIKAEHRGGLSFVASTLKDYQRLRQRMQVNVPWSDKALQLSFSSFRDKLRPGEKETWRITVKDHQGKALSKEAIEFLASMYDKSLDFFAAHEVPSVSSLYSSDYYYGSAHNSLGQEGSRSFNQHRLYPMSELISTQFTYFNYFRNKVMPRPAPSPMMKSKAAPRMEAASAPMAILNLVQEEDNLASSTVKKEQPEFSVRTNFNETAFFYPHLVLDDNDGVSFEFEVPESLTQWKVWISAITKDFAGGFLEKEVRTSKELMVRPYLPRFLREGDRAEIQVAINNNSEEAFKGRLNFEIFDPVTNESLADEFKLDKAQQNFSVAAQESTNLRFSLLTPNKSRMVAIRTTAKTEKFSDGEQRPLAILPSRIHLAQSRFLALTDNNETQLNFSELSKSNDPSRINDKLVVTVDGQLFYSVLNALPYLVDYPYECTEQTLNRYLSTSIISSVFDKHPAVASMAKQFSTRDTTLAKWQGDDPNRKLQLEETPWVVESEGASTENVIRILDPKIAAQQKDSALQRLVKMQTSSGGFPWWDGGPPSPYITQYLLQGFSRSLEFGGQVPKSMVQRAWKYLHTEYSENWQKNDDLHAVTYTNYLLSSYPDISWTGNIFTQKERDEMLAFSFKHWRDLSGLLKSQLALTLHRANRVKDAQLVFASVMDAAKQDKQLGTYWAPEDRSWLWYNDTVDTHAFILRALTELNPNDDRRAGLVQWLMLDKKLNHWKSTRATAESIYALTHYLKQEGQIGDTEKAHITIGNLPSQSLVFEADKYTGANNQIIVKGADIKPEMATIKLQKEAQGLMFASATWHFSTEELPTEAQGDFFKVTRAFFKRVQNGQQWTLQPLAEGATIQVGDQLEVQLSMRAKHSAEFIHLRAPRGAGFEPESQTSGYRWQTQIGYFEEVRDSGINYFFEKLPAGEYSFKYRLRATTAGQFRVAPAQIQSMYAPEFTAYSKGKKLTIH